MYSIWKSDEMPWFNPGLSLSANINIYYTTSVCLRRKLGIEMVLDEIASLPRYKHTNTDNAW